jgi:hypothetical protein
MSFPYPKAKKILPYLFFALCSLLFVSCSRRFEPEPLQLSVKQNLAMLQQDPQFVMYFDFAKMRETGFWKKFISDSIFNAERSFGNFLNVFKNATGAGISGGIDELYFSNSWIGDNAMVIKGTFDKNKVFDYIRSDTNYASLSYPGGITVYNQKPSHFYFYFKDDFTVCASNYLKQIENTFGVRDTSVAGLLTNADAMSTIENIKYKDNLWMMSDQKLFIRGIFENMANMHRTVKEKRPLPGGEDTSAVNDSTENGSSNLSMFYKTINAVSFSLKMTKDLDIVMQNECTDNESAEDLRNKIEGIFALAKLSAQFSRKTPAVILKILDRVDINVYNNTLLLEAKLNEEQVTDIRKQKVF